MIPRIISFAKKRNLLDIPDHRKIHIESIPALGGVAIAICFLLSGLAFIKSCEPKLISLIIGGLGLALIGLLDDIKPQKAISKLGIQVILACFAVFYGEMHFDSLHGSLGISILPYWIGVGFSIFLFILFINAINLIDGVNGLASSLGIFYSLFFGYYFLRTGQLQYVAICLALAGSLIAFLRYNLINPKIFLGDTGSTLIGWCSAFFMIYICQDTAINREKTGIGSVYGILITLFFVPLFDTFRVAFQRILKQKSAFSPDKTHIHHFFLRLNLKHHHITFIILIANIALFFFGWLLQEYLGNTLIITMLVGIFIFGFFLLEFFILKKIKSKNEPLLTIPYFRKFVGKYWYLFFSVIVFALPFQRWATSIPLIIFLLFWALSFQWKNVDFKNQTHYYITFPSLLFFITLIAYITFGEFILLFKKLELRWLFFVFPLVLFIQKEQFNLKKWYSILAFFLLGVLSYMSASIFVFILKLCTHSEIIVSKDLLLSLSKIPAIYYALLINFALMTTIYLRKSEIRLLQNEWVLFLLSTFLGICMFLIQSKFGFIIMVLVHIVSAYIQWLQFKKFPKTIYSLALLLIIFSTLYFDSSKLSIDYLSHSSLEVEKRLEVWKLGIEKFKTQPFIGDINYSTFCLKDGTSINSHNQWLDFGLELGLIGIIGLLITFLFSFYIAIRSKDYFYKGFLILVLAFSMVESIFASQTGIVFFSIFNSLFLLKSRLRIRTNNNLTV